MIFWAYNILLTLLSLVRVPWMVWRARKRKEGPNWKQRTGDLPIEAPAKGVTRVWVHAVSVGEVMAAIPVLRELRSMAPEVEIVLSTTTSSGQTTAKERAEGLYNHLVYYPIDVLRFVVAAMMRVRPKVVAVMETELWFNFLWAAKQFGARTILLNGRVSDRSFGRSMRVRPYYRALFTNLDRALVQTRNDAERLSALGFAEPEVVGSTKYDGAVEEPVAKNWREEFGIPSGAQVVVVGSTRSSAEEELVADAISGLPKSIYVVHAPRHIERAGDVVATYQAKLKEPIALRSSGQHARILVLDTYGELDSAYSVAEVAVVGGGFDDLGGQNLIQPLAKGVPVIHGPHMQNFRDVADQSVACGASIVARTSSELADALKRLLADPEEQRRMGEAAKSLIHANLGAGKRCAEAIVEALAAEPA